MLTDPHDRSLSVSTILLTGRNGQVGWELERALTPLGCVVALDHGALDLTKPDRIASVVRETKPNIIVNAAAYTAVDRAESEPESAFAVNAKAPGILAEEAKRLNALLVHYSTDYVFDGKKNTPYTEDDAPNPLNVYGRTKLEGERAIGESGAQHLIFRTSWVYGMRGQNFLLTMLRLGRERDELRIVNDQIGAPTWCRDLAQSTAKVLSELGAKGTEHRKNVRATYHMTAGGKTSWYGFAERIFLLDTGHKVRRLVPIPSSEYPLPAKRPGNSVLSNTAFARDWGFSLPDWDESLRACMVNPRSDTPTL